MAFTHVHMHMMPAIPGVCQYLATLSAHIRVFRINQKIYKTV